MRGPGWDNSFLRVVQDGVLKRGKKMPGWLRREPRKELLEREEELLEEQRLTGGLTLAESKGRDLDPPTQSSLGLYYSKGAGNQAGF